MIEKTLENVHKMIERAGFLVCHQLIRRSLRKDQLQEAIQQLQFAVKELERLIAEKNKTSNTESSNKNQGALHDNNH